MKTSDPFKEENIKKLQLSIYLLPVVGCLPALWTLYQSNSSSKEKSVSRLSVTLTFSWLLAYSLLWLGAEQTSELLSLRLLYLNGMLTSGYFLACLGLIVRLWQGKNIKNLIS